MECTEWQIQQGLCEPGLKSIVLDPVFIFLAVLVIAVVVALIVFFVKKSKSKSNLPAKSVEAADQTGAQKE